MNLLRPALFFALRQILLNGHAMPFLTGLTELQNFRIVADDAALADAEFLIRTKHIGRAAAELPSE